MRFGVMAADSFLPFLTLHDQQIKATNNNHTSC
jgi:hypothetical protein